MKIILISLLTLLGLLACSTPLKTTVPIPTIPQNAVTPIPPKTDLTKPEVPTIQPDEELITRPEVPIIAPDHAHAELPWASHGLAGWYQLQDHGNKTASGQIYDLYGMTAAHANLPLFSRVEITNPHTGQHAIITINDRLTESHLLIKISYFLAQQLGLMTSPSPTVNIRRIDAR